MSICTNVGCVVRKFHELCCKARNVDRFHRYCPSEMFEDIAFSSRVTSETAFSVVTKETAAATLLRGACVVTPGSCPRDCETDCT
jgi:hypothetical protein